MKWGHEKANRVFFRRLQGYCNGMSQIEFDVRPQGQILLRASTRRYAKEESLFTLIARRIVGHQVREITKENCMIIFILCVPAFKMSMINS